VSSPLENARRFTGDPAWRACVELAESRLTLARAELESASPDKFQFVQGRVRELRNLLQDLTGQKR
jgi:hypothetical protein